MFRILLVCLLLIEIINPEENNANLDFAIGRETLIIKTNNFKFNFTLKTMMI